MKDISHLVSGIMGEDVCLPVHGSSSVYYAGKYTISAYSLPIYRALE